MNKKNIVIALITMLNLIEIILIKPLIPAFFILSFWGKALYILGLYTYPVLIVIPIVLLMFPVAYFIRNSLSICERWIKYSKNLFLAVAILLLLFNALLLYIKTTSDKNIFRLTKYADIQQCAEHTSDLRIGRFEMENNMIQRYDSIQVERSYDGSSRMTFKIEWLSDCEYRLIPQDTSNKDFIGSIDVKITNNTIEYYECFAKIGEYAQYYKVLKK